MPLNERERAVLDFEASCRARGWVKEEQIRSTLGMSPARYFQLLSRLLDSLDAQAYDPLLMGRLRRLRDRGRGFGKEGAPATSLTSRGSGRVAMGGAGSII